MSERCLFYFGCIECTGHYLFVKGERSARDYDLLFPDANQSLMKAFNRGAMDGVLTPPLAEQGKYQESIIPPFRLVAWGDYTVDNRCGSNSVLIGYGYDSAEQILDDAPNWFPSVMKRQPRPTPFMREHQIPMERPK